MTKKVWQTLLWSGFLLLGLRSPAAFASADDVWDVDLSESLFAVVTHKAGVASAFAHEHFIVAQDPQVALRGDITSSDAAHKAVWHFAAESSAFEVDNFNILSRWRYFIERMQPFEAAPEELSESDRAEIRMTMLSDSQLKAQTYTHVRASFSGLTPLVPSKAPFTARDKSQFFTAKIELEIAGKHVTKTVPVAVLVDGAKIIGESMFELKFSDFGIQPYTALLGAVQVTNRFHVLVYVLARKKTKT